MATVLCCKKDDPREFIYKVVEEVCNSGTICYKIIPTESTNSSDTQIVDRNDIVFCKSTIRLLAAIYKLRKDTMEAINAGRNYSSLSTQYMNPKEFAIQEYFAIASQLIYNFKTAEEKHNHWYELQKDCGWVFGMATDVASKTSNLIKPFNLLNNKVQQDKVSKFNIMRDFLEALEDLS